MLTTGLQTTGNPFYGVQNSFGHPPMMRFHPQRQQYSPFQNFTPETEISQEAQLPFTDNISSGFEQHNMMTNPQLEYNMMNYMKRFNDWHNMQMAMGRRQMFHNQMAYQNFMGRIGMPFLRMF